MVLRVLRLPAERAVLMVLMVLLELSVLMLMGCVTA